MLSLHYRYIMNVFGWKNSQFRKGCCAVFSRMHMSRALTPDNNLSYLFGKSISFRDLGVNVNLCKALDNTSKAVATKIQTEAFLKVLSGKDVVIGAETGSGKTLSYLIPLFQLILEGENHGVQKPDYPTAIIVVPNKDLCCQVECMAREILVSLPLYESNDHTLKIASALSAVGQWPYTTEVSPDILVCTPAFLSAFIKGPNILLPELFDNLRYLVLDEADMLLESFPAHMQKIIDTLKVLKRRKIKENSLDASYKNVQYILSAATLPSSGARSTKRLIMKTFPEAIYASNDHLHQHHPCIHQTYIEITKVPLTDPRRLDSLCRVILAVSDGDGASDVMRLPADGSIVQQDILIQSTTVVEASHESVTTVSELDDEEEELPLDCTDQHTEHGFANNENIVPTIIFANTANGAAKLAAALRAHKFMNASLIGEFHKNIPATTRQEALENFKNFYIKILVCTDAASRGLDMPHIKHVIQAEFSENVVNHQHRIGRASRGGALGMATNFYDDSSSHLVKLMLRGSDGKSIDQSFSRRRGLRSRMKRQAKWAQEHGNDENAPPQINPQVN